MRYFIYKDSEVVGPFEPQELGQAAGLSPDSLVCTEVASGRYDNDWIPASEVSELAGLRLSAPTATALLDETWGGEAAGYERLELDTAAFPETVGQGEGWLMDLMDEEQFRQRWGELLPKPPPDAEAQAQARIRELTGQLQELRARLAEMEIARATQLASPPPVPPQPPPSAELLGQLGALKTRLDELEKAGAAPAPAKAAPSAEIAPAPVKEPPPIKLAATPTAASSGPIAPPPIEPPVVEPPAPMRPAPAAPRGPRTEFEKQGSKFTFKGQPKAAPKDTAKTIKFKPAQSFRVVEKEPHPASLPISHPPESFQAQGPAAPTSVYEWSAAAQPPTSPGIPAAGQAPMLSAAEAPTSGPSLPSLSAPPPMPTPLPAFEQPAALPAAPAALTSPPSMAATPPTPAPTLSLEAPPLTFSSLSPAPTAGPVAGPATFGGGAPSAFGSAGAASPPITMMFGAPAGAPAGVPPLEPPPVPQMPAFGVPAPGGYSGPALTPSRANEGVVTPASGPDDVVARLAKPAEAPATDKKEKPPRKSSKMLVVGVIGLLALFALIVLFLRDRRGLKSMVTMGGDQKPIGSAVEEEPKAPAAPKLAPQTPPPGSQPVVPPPSMTGADKIPDAGEAAVNLVKNYPLTGERGTVGQWLTYSYNQDGASKEDWNAGAVDSSVYAVEYKVQPAPSSQRKETISYLFEADTARKTVLGKNAAALSLLRGGDAAKPKKTAAKPGYKRRPLKKAAAVPPTETKKVDLLPLPSDNELLPPGDDGAGFKSDTVEP